MPELRRYQDDQGRLFSMTPEAARAAGYKPAPKKEQDAAHGRDVPADEDEAVVENRVASRARTAAPENKQVTNAENKDK